MSIRDSKIYAKSALLEAQLDSKLNIGCDGIELQLLSELVKKLGDYNYAEDVFDLSKGRFDKYIGKIKVVHAPLLSHYGLDDVCIESVADSEDFMLLDQICYVANWFGERQQENITIVIHSETTVDTMLLIGDTWKRVLNAVGYLLFKYKYIEIAFENVTPLRVSKFNKQLKLCNNFMTDNLDMIKRLRENLNTDRVGTVLDICHARMTEKYMTAIYKEMGDRECEDYSLENFFRLNKDYIKLIHLAGMQGSGYGRGNHGTIFDIEDADSMNNLRKFIELYDKYEYDCPITLEVEETDYLTSEGYKKSREALESLRG